MAVKEGRYQIGSETRESRRDILSFLSHAYDTLILVIIKKKFWSNEQNNHKQNCDPAD